MDSTWHQFVDFAVDWHYMVTSQFLESLTYFSRFWRIVSKLHGNDVDFNSVCTSHLPPSKVDLVSVKNSFVSVSSFSTQSNNKYHQIKIENSSVGYRTHFSAKEDINIFATVVPPMVNVTGSIHQTKLDSRMQPVKKHDVILQECFLTLLYLLSFMLVFCTLIPPYELWVTALGDLDTI